MPVFQADEAVEIAFDAAGLSVFTSANLQALGEDIDAELASFGTMRFENAADYLTTAAAAVTYQPIDSDLTALAGLTGTNTIYYRSGVATWSPVTVGSGLSFSGGTLATSGVLLTANNLSELTATASTARANLGLGTMAVETAANYLTVAAAAAGYQPLDGDLSALAALSGTNTIYYRSAANTWSAVTVGTGLSFSGGTLATSGGGGGTPGGSNTQIQYNNSGAFAGSSSLTFNSTLGQVAVPSISLTGNISSPAWTTNGIGIAHTTRTLTDTTSAGTVAASYTSVLGGNTIAANSATTFTDYASLWLGTPTAGTNVTITNPYSLVTAGAARFGGQVTVAGPLRTDEIYGQSNVVSFLNSTNSQTIKVFNTYTSATNGEFLQARGVAGANFEIGPSNGSAGGTLRGLTIGGYSNGSSTITPWLTFTNAGVATFNVAATLTASSFTSDYGNFTNPSFIIGAKSQGFGASGSTLYGRMSSNIVWAATTSAFRVGTSQVVGWSSTGDAQTSADAGLARNAAGVVEINTGTAGVYGSLVLKDLRMSTPTVPATSSSTGSQGQISWDSNYVYVCTATNTWKRAALSTF